MGKLGALVVCVDINVDTNRYKLGALVVCVDINVDTNRCEH